MGERVFTEHVQNMEQKSHWWCQFPPTAAAAAAAAANFSALSDEFESFEISQNYQDKQSKLKLKFSISFIYLHDLFLF